MQSDTVLSGLINGIQRDLSKNYESIAEYISVFQPYKTLFFENSDYVENIRELYANVDLEEYAAAIAKYKDQSADFNEIPCVAFVEMFRVDSQALKMRLMPSPVLCLNFARIAT